MDNGLRIYSRTLPHHDPQNNITALDISQLLHRIYQEFLSQFGSGSLVSEMICRE